MIRADLDGVQVWCDGQVVADHARVWARHQTLSDPEHVAAAKLLRRGRADPVRPVQAAEVEIRKLSDYDTVLGVDGGAA